MKILCPWNRDAAPENVQMPEEVPSQESLDGFVTGIAESAGEGEEGFFSEEVGETDAGIDTEAAPLSGNCGEGVIWSLADGVMTIEGNGAMDDYIVMKDFWTGQIIEEETHRRAMDGLQITDQRDLHKEWGYSYWKQSVLRL